jgi:hydrogenase expression/formation protein HypC
MCLAVPMKIIQINGDMGVVEVDGIRREVGLMLLDDARINDWVIIHAGFAISKLSVTEAKQTLKLFDEMAKGFSR